MLRPCAFALISFVAAFLTFAPGNTSQDRSDVSVAVLPLRPPPPTPGARSVEPSLPATPAPLPVCDVQLLPITNVQEAIDANPPATSFCFAPGSYRVSNLNPKHGDSFFGQLTAILTGGDTAQHAFRSTAGKVTIAGLVIERFNSPLQHGAVEIPDASAWTIRDNEIRYNAASGIFWGGSGTRVTGNKIHHNGQEGFACYRARNTLIEGNEIAFNNTRGIDVDFEAGGGKCTQTDHLTVRDNWVHDNRGPGLWTDANNIHTLYEGNRVENNTASGIFHEISYDAIIRNNVVTGNAASWRNGIWRAGIVIANSSNVEVYGNTLEGNGNGIAGTEQQRGSGSHGPWLLRNLRVHGNRITLRSGETGIVHDGGARQSIWQSSRFRNNVYYLRSASCRCFRWLDREMTNTEWKKAGQDRGGRFYEL